MRRTIAAVLLGFVLVGCSDGSDTKSDSSHPAVAPSSQVTTTPTPLTKDGARWLIKDTTWLINDPSPSLILGRWSIISVNGKPPPKDAISGLKMVRQHGKYFASWSDGVNAHSRQWFLTQGKIRWGGEAMTAVFCRGPKPCMRPSGFGVGEATRLGLATTTGPLLLLDAKGAVLAVYQRERKPLSSSDVRGIAPNLAAQD